MSRRIRQWQSLLDQCINERKDRPFAWGSHDCALFAADCVLAVTGEDPAKDLRGTYGSASSAAAKLDELGGLGEIAGSRLGEQVPIRMIQTGDVVLADIEGRDTLTVYVGGHLMGPGEKGLVSIPLSRAVSAWRCTKS